MATRSVIRLKGSKIELYKHWDGYPDATLPWLKDFTINFLDNRGNDAQYFLAQLVRSSINDAKKYKLDDSLFTGWGLGLKNSFGGIEYIYEIDLDKQIIKVNNKKIPLLRQIKAV